MLRKVALTAITIIGGVSGGLWILGFVGWVSFEVRGVVWLEDRQARMVNVVATDHAIEVGFVIPGSFWPDFFVGVHSLHIGTIPDSASGMTFVSSIAPWWFPFVLFGTYPAVRFVRRKRREHRIARRRTRGQCITCGYNLTGNRSGTCPECGMASRGPEKARKGGQKRGQKQ